MGCTIVPNTITASLTVYVRGAAVGAEPRCLSMVMEFFKI